MLAGRCYDVILNGFGRPEEIQFSLEECKKLGAKLVEHHGADLSDSSLIEACFKYVEDKCGNSPDVLVNNAGEFCEHIVIRCISNPQAYPGTDNRISSAFFSALSSTSHSTGPTTYLMRM